MARLVMAVSESSTVARSFLSEVQDLMILKILSNLNALRTDRLELLSALSNSTKLMMTMKQSKILKPYSKYFLHPNPINFITISTAKIIVKIKLAIVPVVVTHAGSLWCSIAMKKVFSRIRTTMNRSNSFPLLLLSVLSGSHTSSSLSDSLAYHSGVSKAQQPFLWTFFFPLVSSSSSSKFCSFSPSSSSNY